MKFDSLTVFVLASNETHLLRATVNSIKTNCGNDLERIVIVAKNSTCPSYTEAIAICEEEAKAELYVQKAPTAQLCLAELPALAESSHFVIMAADMEMNPSDLAVFIKKAKEHPCRIICAAKWMPGSTVTGYGFFHAFCSKAMNRFISILFGKKVYDPFSIYQIYPVSLYRKMNFDSPGKFLYEYTLKPLSLGEEYEEISTVYNKRNEGKSNFNFATLVSVGSKFVLTGLKIKFKSQV
ncbi:MAG: hypothetical protein J6A60_04060 [Clostridia bacterium]|nr:hypothetical protein [Clostridia bacterium]